MGAAAALLSPRRALGLAVLLAALAAYGAGAGVFPNVSEPWDVAFFALVLFPATLAVAWLLLPLHRARGVGLVAVPVVVLAVLLRLAHVDSVFNVTKLVAIVLLGFAFMAFFQPPLGLVAAIAAIIPWVDAYSVWRGPTKHVIDEHPSVFDNVAIAFRALGENGAAQLGPPDVLFFTVFLTAAETFRLRTAATFAGMIALLGVTVACTSAFDLSGLPALPAVSLGFLLPNADLLWTRFRAWQLSDARGG